MPNLPNSLEYLRKKPEFSDVDHLSKFYEKLEPSAKKILALLMTDPKDDAEREAFGFFRRFVRGLDIVHLKKLLKLNKWVRYDHCIFNKKGL